MEYAYLVCVDGERNANKFYELKQISADYFEVRYGREGGHVTTKVYPMRKWRTTYRNRVKASKKPRPYTDVTHLKLEAEAAQQAGETSSFSGISDVAVRQLIRALSNAAGRSVRSNYKVSSANVTQAMLDSAQSCLDRISKLVFTPSSRVRNRHVNELLEELYVVLPRKMKKVSDHLLPFTNDLIDTSLATHLYHTEQANVDVMAQQVHTGTVAAVDDDGGQSVLDSLGINIRPAQQPEIDAARAMAPRNWRRIKEVYAVEHLTGLQRFNSYIDGLRSKGAEQDRLTVKKYWHGSRTENWLSILQKGLLIRPPRARSTGDMYGIGIYFADKWSKSFNYTSCRGSHWARGTAGDGYMALFDVHIGRPYIIKNHNYSCYKLSADVLARKGAYDSVLGKRGADLINDEYIIYRPEQCTIALLVRVS